MVSDHENPNKSGAYWGFGFFVIGLEGRCSIQLSYGRVLWNQRLAEIIPTPPAGSASPNRPPRARTTNDLGPSRRKPSGRTWTICDGRMPVQGMNRKRTTVSDPRVNGSSASTTRVRSGSSSQLALPDVTGEQPGLVGRGHAQLPRVGRSGEAAGRFVVGPRRPSRRCGRPEACLAARRTPRRPLAGYRQRPSTTAITPIDAT